jgi:hypothetical protein
MNTWLKGRLLQAEERVIRWKRESENSFSKQDHRIYVWNKGLRDGYKDTLDKVKFASSELPQWLSSEISFYEDQNVILAVSYLATYQEQEKLAQCYGGGYKYTLERVQHHLEERELQQ